MELEDIPQVLEVDRESYTLPWPASAYRREILHNRNARYVVLREAADEEDVHSQPQEPRPRLPFPFLRWPLRSADGTARRPARIVGYAGMWLMVDEAHITTIAIREEWRSRGLGELLLISLIDEASDMGAHRVTLEVRVSNEVAQNLYSKYGFRREGVRPRYYSDNNEDAFIMTTDDIRATTFQERYSRLLHAMSRRLEQATDFWMSPSPLEREQETAQRAEPG